MRFAWLFFLALLVPFAAAEDVFREPEVRSAPSLYLYNFPYWAEVNETSLVYVTNLNSAATNYAEITLGSGNASNMTYVSGSNVFRVGVTSGVEEDVPFTVRYYSSGGSLLGSLNDTLRFRVPFDVSFTFYKTKNSSSDLEPYDNEFQYAVLKYAPEDAYSYTLAGGGSSLAWLNSIGRLFPYYRDVGDAADEIRVTDEVFLYAQLDDGVATIKVYENASYALSTMSTKVYGGLSPLYEFGRPISNTAVPFRSAVAGEVAIQTEADAGYSVYISAWEVYKWALVFSFGKIVLLLLVWGLLVIALAYLLTGWLPPDMRQSAFASVVGVICFCTSPLLIVGVRILW